MTPSHLADALGHDTSDKRLDILRRVDEAGSISEAARGAGVSYKAAWQAVETLSSLAGLPLVERVVGGAGGGGARLTEAGRRVLLAAERLQSAREAVLRELAASTPSSTPPGSAALPTATTLAWPLLGAVALRTSMRNQLPCQVQRLVRQAGAVLVHLQLNDGQALRARITRESAQLLDLRPGLPVLALCKATAVQLSAEVVEGPGNVLHGQISRSAPARGGEASLRLPGGLQLVGLSEAGLKSGVGAWARFDESAVVVALG